MSANGQDRLAVVAYREMLYDYYRHDYFSAAIKLLTFEAQGRLPVRAQDLSLARGAVYAALGLDDEAEKILSQLADENPPAAIADVAWLHLGRLRLRHDDADGAQKALLHIKGSLADDLSRERQALLIDALLARGQSREAAEQLRHLDKQSSEYDFARNNLAVALIRHGEAEEGVRLLEKQARLRARDAERQALRDKANVTLGFLYLEDKKPQESLTYFQRVRLDGPFSNKAMLGLGRAWSALGDYQKALVSWNALRKRDVTDAMVQEALLATPFAFEHLEAQQQALTYYQDAVSIYTALEAQLNATGKTLRNGKAVSVWRDLGRGDNGQFTRRLEDLAKTDGLGSFYLQLFGDAAFRRAFSDYRELQKLAANLDAWAYKIDVYESSLAQQRRAPETPAAGPDAVVLQRLQAKHDRYQDELARSGFVPQLSSRRNRQERRRREDLSNELALVDRMLGQLRNYRRPSPKPYVMADDKRHRRLATLKPRLQSLRVNVDESLLACEQRLTDLAVAEMEAQRRRVAVQLIQARYAVAQAYDQAQERAHP